jgi:nitrate reductase NapE component
MQMNHDMVFWGVAIGVAGAFGVMAWLFYVIYRNTAKGK